MPTALRAMAVADTVAPMMPSTRPETRNAKPFRPRFIIPYLLKLYQIFFCRRQKNISLTLKNDELLVEDNDGFKIALVEMEEQIAPHKATKHTSIPANKQIIRIAKVSIVADQFKETQRFLSDYLSLKQENDTFFTEQHLDQTTVLASQSKDQTRFGRGTIDHIAYGVDSNDELEGFYQQALTDHWTVEEYVDRGYFKSLYIKEPSGLRIELATLSPGFQLDESLEELGTHLALPPFLEKNRTAIEAQLEEIK